MIKDITIGQYIPGESFIHKLDPRTKILITFLFNNIPDVPIKSKIKNKII